MQDEMTLTGGLRLARSVEQLGTESGAQGKRHLRISYANSRDQLELALDRIRAFLEAETVAGMPEAEVET